MSTLDQCDNSPEGVFSEEELAATGFKSPGTCLIYFTLFQNFIIADLKFIL